MIQNMQLHIPKPCHEDWNKMNPTTQGRHCQNCYKKVVDFTTMSDEQVMHYLTITSGETCGRIRKDQLKRRSYISYHRPWKWIMAGVASLFFFFNKVSAQKKEQYDFKKDTVKQSKKTSNIIMGMIVAPNIRPVKKIPAKHTTKEDVVIYADTTKAKAKDYKR